MKQYITPEHILTDQEESLLMGVRDSIRDNYFLVGRIVNDKLKVVARAQEDVSFKDVYHSVGRIIGKSKRTVRYYAEVEAFYSVKAQQEYDILPFAFFDYARGFEDWREVLDYAMEHPSYSLAAVKREFSKTSTITDAPNETMSMFDFANKLSQLCDFMQEASDTLELMAMEMDNIEVEQEVNELNGTLKSFTSGVRNFLARIVDKNPVYA